MAFGDLGGARPVVWVGVGDAEAWDYGVELAALRDDPVTLVQDVDRAGAPLQGWIR